MWTDTTHKTSTKHMQLLQFKYNLSAFKFLFIYLFICEMILISKITGF